ncbi:MULTISPECIES: hypothetical protein [Ponticoccus]|uniref:Glycine zipper domain-containing protein n=1 Tax=Ponticoccus litoralis TaxID=422297 RepID=A0AAW9SU89_9RHOB
MRTLIIALTACTALAACEGTDLERGALGAGIAGGAAMATGGNVAGAAAVGGLAGVVCDDVTPQLCR